MKKERKKSRIPEYYDQRRDTKTNVKVPSESQIENQKKWVDDTNQK